MAALVCLLLKVVILDEPTSGMDPYARQKTWELIRRHLPGRTILISTHCMEEAEAVGDRIAIMVNGVVKCCGSSMFLKSRFGRKDLFVHFFCTQRDFSYVIYRSR